MSSDDLRHLYWTIGASGKRSEEARAAGCVGMFGIGGFANLGVCERLIVISQPEGCDGNRTELSRADIDNANGLPQVAQESSDQAAPRGTIVEGILDVPTEEEELRRYIQEIVRYCHEPIYFNDTLISGEQPSASQSQGDIVSQTLQDSNGWSYNGIDLSGMVYKIDDQTLGAKLDGLYRNGEASKLSAILRFEGNGIDIRKQGFKLCATSVATRIGHVWIHRLRFAVAHGWKRFSECGFERSNS